MVIVVSNLLAWPFICGCYAVFFMCSTPRRAQMVAKNFLKILVPLSFRINVGMSKEMSHCLWKIFAMCVAVVLDVGTALVSLAYWSVLKSMYWLPSAVHGNRSHDVHRNKFKRSRCWKELQLTLMPVLGVDFRTDWAFAYNLVSVCGHMRPVKVATYCVVHVSLTWISRDRWVMRYYEFGMTMRWWALDLYGAVDY